MRFILTIAVLGAMAAGCGGGGGGDRLSEKEFRTQANAVCKRYDDKIAALGTPSSAADIPQFVEEGIPLIEQGIAELRALRPPADVQEDYDRMLSETQKAIPAARKLAQAAEKQDAAAVQEALKAGNEADEASDRLASKLGLSECAAE